MTLAMSESEAFDPERMSGFVAWQIAYLGRYGRIGLGDLWDKPVSFVRQLVSEVGELLKREAEAAKGAGPMGMMGPGSEWL